MSKKTLIKSLAGGVLCGVLIYAFIQIFLFFIEDELDYDEMIDGIIENRSSVLEDKYSIKEEQVHPIDFDDPEVAVVTFKYEIRIQNSYDDEQLEVLPTIEDVLDYLSEYSRFHEDLYVYDMETRELVLDSKTYGQIMQELMSKEDLLIDASNNPDKYTDEQIFQLLVD